MKVSWKGFFAIVGGGIAALVLATYVGMRYVAEPAFPTLYNEQMAAGTSSALELAAPQEALSFARTSSGGSTSVLLVTSYQDDTVTGVPLLRADGTAYSDPISALDELGYQAIAALASQPDEVSVPTAELAPTLDAGNAHVAMGTNYADHAEETAQEEVFLFPKRVEPTASRGSLAAGEGLLDYEIELALVPLQDLHAGEATPASMGLILANDFTDRQMLLEQGDTSDITSGQGFTNAKSQPGFLPTGDLFVVPQDWRTFYEDLQLDLYVDGDLRQRDTPANLILGPDDILEEIFEAGDRTWDHDGTAVHATEEVGTIPQGSLIMTGTPAGVTFRPPDTRQIAMGVMEYGATLGTNADSVVDSAIGVYIREASDSKAYLQPGQQVVSRADRLGQTIIDIAPGDRPDRDQATAAAG